MDADELQQHDEQMRGLVRLATQQLYPIICNHARLWCLNEFGEMNPGIIRENFAGFWLEHVTKN